MTGAGKRIGQAFAEALAADGWFVFVHYHQSAAEAHETVRRIRAGGGAAKAVRADLGSARAAAALVDRCAASDMVLACIVNSASVFELDRIASVTAPSFDKHMAVNLRAPLLIAQVKAAAEAGIPVIVIDSGEHLTGRPRDIAFDRRATKAKRR